MVFFVTSLFFFTQKSDDLSSSKSRNHISSLCDLSLLLALELEILLMMALVDGSVSTSPGGAFL